MEPRNRQGADNQGDETSDVADHRRVGGEQQPGSDTEPKSATLSAIERQKLALAARDDARHVGRRSRRRRARSGTPFALLVLSLTIAIGLAIVYTDIDELLLEQVDALRPAPVANYDEYRIEPLDPVDEAPSPAQAVPEPSDIEVASGTIRREPLSDSLPDPIDTLSSEETQSAAEVLSSEQVLSTVDAVSSEEALSSVDAVSSDEAPSSVDAVSSADTSSSADTPSTIDIPSSTETPSPAERPQVPAGVLSLPVEKLSLHDQPDLFRQLVQLYSSTLAENPDDAEAADVLQRLQSKTYAELEAAIEAQEMAVANRLVKYAGELFPEMKEELRYQALSALVTQKKQAASVVAEEARQKAPPRPYINSLSMSLGSLENDRFVPRDDGTVVMIRIDYSNFNNAPASPGEDTLLLRIRAAGNPLTMAEVPVPIHGDRGAKSFTVDTMIKGGGVEYYQLDFILHGRVLESRIVARTPIH